MSALDPAGQLTGRVALVTGAARGVGLRTAVLLAEHGADIIGLDRSEHLADLRAQVEATGRRVVAVTADVVDLAATRAAVDIGVAELGRLDIVVANAGIVVAGAALDITDEQWQQSLDVNLTGVWNTCRAAVPHVLAAGDGGSIVITSSTAGIKGFLMRASYVASKHGVTGLARTLAAELGPHSIRVNTVHPTRVDTPMLDELKARDDPNNTDLTDTSRHLLPVYCVETIDVANAILFLASDAARYITGVALPVDAGALQK
jgi:(+)-trans-carveol dehydrogenase